jgi:predicted nucleotidyltransferase
MKPETKILKLLLENKEERFTIRNISEKTKINYRIAHGKIKELEQKELIKITKVGNSSICELTHKFSKEIFVAEYERREELFKDKKFKIIHSYLSELKFPFIVLLFGSYSKKTADKHSDIDILTIGGDEKKISSQISLLSYDTHLTSISYEEFIHMAKSKEFTVVSEAIKNNIILLGIEEYYRILSNAR